MTPIIFLKFFRVPRLSVRGLSTVSRRAGVLAAAVLLAALPCQAKPAVSITGQKPGVVPFINFVSLSVDNPKGLDFIKFKVDSKPGSVVRPVTARYSAAYLAQNGFFDATTGVVTLPVFGLYANFNNTVTVTTRFITGASEVHVVKVGTSNFRDTVHKHPNVVQARTKDTTLSYDYLLLKDGTSDNTPLVLDTDGEIRWAGLAGGGGTNTIFYNNSIYVSSGKTMLRSELNGVVFNVIGDYEDQGVVDFHHNLDVGRDGIIADVDTTDQLESVNIEIDPKTGAVLHTWNLADIISAAMSAGGDDPSLFVHPPPFDWFHTNAATYRASDDTIIISSRENFVIALDYDTGAIRWILGDTTKQWYQFPSLRKYALTLGPNTHEPIGQHSVSVVRDRLLLFDDGFGSLSQTPKGKTRKYSAARKYVIDSVNMTATETWNYTADKMISSPVCSSVYEDEPHSFLVDYATEGFSLSTPAATTEIVGLSPSGARVFDYKYPAVATCASGWNAQPIHFEGMVFN